MDHGGHGGYGGHDMPMDMPKCDMNMLWNYQIEDTCVVFRSWHISGYTTMLISCIMIVLISVGYASLLNYTQRYERRVALQLAQDRPAGYAAVDDSPGVVPKFGVTRLPPRARINRAALYAASVAISYFLMLVAMTYNLYLCSAIVLGAFAGHYMYEGEVDLNSLIGGSSARGLACH